MDIRSSVPEEGKKLGISTALRNRQNGEYETVVYHRSAQQFIIDHLTAILKQTD